MLLVVYMSVLSFQQTRHMRFCFNVGIASQTLVQHWTNIRWMSRFWWDSIAQAPMLVNGYPPCTTLAQHCSNIGSKSRVFWECVLHNGNNPWFYLLPRFTLLVQINRWSVFYNLTKICFYSEHERVSQPCVGVLSYVHITVPLDMKGCIFHFTKWQINPFISNGTNYEYEHGTDPSYVLVELLTAKFQQNRSFYCTLFWNVADNSKMIIYAASYKIRRHVIESSEPGGHLEYFHFLSLSPYLISKSMHLFTYLLSFIIVEKSERFFSKQLHYYFGVCVHRRLYRHNIHTGAKLDSLTPALSYPRWMHQKWVSQFSALWGILSQFSG